MASSTLVSLDEYLQTVYEPDCEYIGSSTRSDVAPGPTREKESASRRWC